MNIPIFGRPLPLTEHCNGTVPIISCRQRDRPMRKGAFAPVGSRHTGRPIAAEASDRAAPPGPCFPGPAGVGRVRCRRPLQAARSCRRRAGLADAPRPRHKYRPAHSTSARLPDRCSVRAVHATTAGAGSRDPARAAADAARPQARHRGAPQLRGWRRSPAGSACRSALPSRRAQPTVRCRSRRWVAAKTGSATTSQYT